jgi:hypothetical protein
MKSNTDDPTDELDSEPVPTGLETLLNSRGVGIFTFVYLVVLATIGAWAAIKVVRSENVEHAWVAILFLLAAALLLMLPRYSEITLGQQGITAKLAQQLARKSKAVTAEKQKSEVNRQFVENILQRTASSSDGAPPATVTRADVSAIKASAVRAALPSDYRALLDSEGIETGTDPEDPLRTGTRPSETDDYILSAKVEPNGRDWYSIRLLVERKTPDVKDAAVRFFLHHTFPTPVKKARFIRRYARATCGAYGSFTVVAKVGEQLLELDLASVPGAPSGFQDN